MKFNISLYRYQGRWWHGELYRGYAATDKIWRELFWLLRHGKYHACWQWPQLIFGADRTWYDGPIWFIHAGIFSIDLTLD